MFDIPFGNILPGSVVAGLALFAGAHYFVIAPAIANRVVTFDHLPRCESSLKTLVLAQSERRASELEKPQVDAGKAFAAEQIELLRQSPMMQELEGIGELFGMDEMLDTLTRQQRQASEAARKAHDRTLARLEEDTAASIDGASTTCACLAREALAVSRTDWALFTGSFGLITPATITNFDDEISRAFDAGLCQARPEDAR